MSSALAQLSGRVCASGEPRIRQEVLFLNALDEPIHSQSCEHKKVAVVGNDHYLMLIPLFGDLRQSLLRIRAISADLTVYSYHELQWRLDVRLIVLFENALLQCLDDAAGPARSAAFVYLYSNGAFQKRYYPGILNENLAMERLNLNLNQNPIQRLYNPKTEMIAEAFGANSLANLIIHFDQSGSMCSVFDHHLDVVGIGRGNRVETRLMGAVYEYLERRVSAELPHSLLWSAYEELVEPALPPHGLFGSPEKDNTLLFPQYSPAKPIAWMRGRDICRGRDIWLPAAMVCYLDSQLEKLSFNTNSNGCALGNSWREASFYSLLEVVERDALLLTWYTQSSPTRICLDDTVADNLVAIEETLSNHGYRLHLFDITTDINIPVVLSVLEGMAPNKMAAFVTAGAHTNPSVALESAVTEAFSLYALCERNYFQYRNNRTAVNKYNAEQYFEYADPHNKSKLAFLFGAKNRQTAEDFAERHHLKQVSSDTFTYVIEQLERGGYYPVCVENSPDYLRDLGLHWVRSYVPELINLVFGRKPVFVSPQRIEKAVRGTHWIRHQSIGFYSDLHPLG